MIVISTWLWGSKYSTDEVLKLRRGVSKHLRQAHRFIVMTERERDWTPPDGIERHAIKDPELLNYKGCFVRLRMFDRGWQKNRGIDDRLVCLDLDMIIIGGLDLLFDRPDPFVILGGANSMNPCPYNGSVMMLRSGYRPDIWDEFSVEAASKIKHYEFPDDQGWIWHKAPNAAVWPCGRKSGIYAFMKPGWPPNGMLPSNARIVAFPGSRSPRDYKNLPWVKEHWL
jgi:hypothetical protein